MNASAEFTIGSQVECDDGVCGELRRVVVDPVARTLTHLVVDTKHRQGTGHLVPIVLASPEDGGIRLRCTAAEFEALDFAESTQLVPGARGQWSYGQEDLLSLPYYALGAGMGGSMGVVPGDTVKPVGQQTVTYDRVPLGEIQVKRGERVHAADGDIGLVQGLVVDPADHGVTHVLLDEGHLWGKKRVAIPIGAVQSVVGGVHLNITKDEVRDLPPIDVDDEDEDEG